MPSNYRAYQPEQSYLLPPSPSDWLPQNHLAFFISDVVEEMDLSAFHGRYEEGDPRGNQPFHPAMMLKILIYAYATGTFSSRRIAQKIEEDVAFRVLASGNFPQHRTICDFRQEHLQKFVELFKQVVLIAKSSGLIKLGRVAIDGTKIKANASRHKAMSYDRMKQEEKKLEPLAPGLELVKDYGIFTILAKPLYWLLDKLHGFIGNWGFSIMALVLLIKIAFYWLQAKGYQSMAKMKAINPKVMAMRERYKDNPQQMQQEMMRIYREEKVNPLGGCLPILVQIPVFIALYWVLVESVELRHAPWILWIDNLSARDPYFVLPALNMLAMFLTQKLSPAPGMDPMQRKMMQAMPFVFGVMFAFFPAGLVLYWATNGWLGLIQQWYIMRRHGEPVKA